MPDNDWELTPEERGSHFERWVRQTTAISAARAVERAALKKLVEYFDEAGAWNDEWCDHPDFRTLRRELGMEV